MLISYGKHGAGSCLKACRYVLDSLDHKGRERPAVEVLSGNWRQVAALADSSSAKLKYRSALIAWAPSDQPTDDQIREALQSWENLAFPGLSRDQFTYLAVLHRDDRDGCHIHMIIPRRLLDGRSYNVAPPGWQAGHDQLRDYLNHKYGWSSPADPSRARVAQTGRWAVVAADRKRDGLAVAPGDNPREALADYVLGQIAAGRVECSRAGVVAALAQLGEVTRQGKDYVSLRLEPGSKPIRLKGLLFNESLDGSALAASAAGGAPAGPTDGRPDRRNPAAAEAARLELERHIERRARYNRERYGRGPRTTAADLGRDDGLAGQGSRDVAPHDGAPGQAPAHVAGDRSAELVADDRGRRGELGLADGSPGQRRGRSSAAGARGHRDTLLRQPGRAAVLPPGPLSNSIQVKERRESPYSDFDSARRGPGRGGERYPLSAAQLAARKRATAAAGGRRHAGRSEAGHVLQHMSRLTLVAYAAGSHGVLPDRSRDVIQPRGPGQLPGLRPAPRATPRLTNPTDERPTMSEFLVPADDNKPDQQQHRPSSRLIAQLLGEPVPLEFSERLAQAQAWRDKAQKDLAGADAARRAGHFELAQQLTGQAAGTELAATLRAATPRQLDALRREAWAELTAVDEEERAGDRFAGPGGLAGLLVQLIRRLVTWLLGVDILASGAQKSQADSNVKASILEALGLEGAARAEQRAELAARDEYIALKRSNTMPAIRAGVDVAIVDRVAGLLTGDSDKFAAWLPALRVAVPVAIEYAKRRPHMRGSTEFERAEVIFEAAAAHGLHVPTEQRQALVEQMIARDRREAHEQQVDGAGGGGDRPKG